MKIYIECSLSDFEPWSGAVSRYNRVADAGKLDELEYLLEGLYPDCIDETQLNDILWFEEEWLFKTLGISGGEDGDYDGNNCGGESEAD